MSTTITLATELTCMNCPSCAGVFAISSNYLREARQLGHFKQCWKCPYCGESRGYGESAHEKEKRELEQRIASEQRSKEFYKDRMEYSRKEAEHFRKSRDGWKGVAVKTRKRVAKGTCPCCNRHFPNDKMAAHIASKHPGFESPQA